MSDVGAHMPGEALACYDAAVEPQAHNRQFSCISLGVAEPSRDLRVVFLPVAEEQVISLAAQLAKKLAEPLPSPPQELQATLRPGDVIKAPAKLAGINVPGYPPLHGVVDRFGETALRVTWLHRMVIEVGTKQQSGQVQAVSIYLTGLDRDADNAVIASCAKMRIGGGPLPVTQNDYQRMRQASRPLAVQVFAVPLARLDPSLRCAYLGMGVAFFSNFGVDEPPTQG